MQNGLDAEMNGLDDSFQATHWTRILNARALDKAVQQAAINELITTYWRPVYCYLQRKGYDSETAKDLVQGFFLDVVIERNLIQRADPGKGRFRMLLLAALDRYVTSVGRAERAAKRRPAGGLVALHNIDWMAGLPPARVATPEDTFNYTWASKLLDDVLAQLERECAESGKTIHWDVFCARVVDPILHNDEPVPVSDLCARHGIESERKAWDMVSALKHRFQEVLRSHVRLSVASEAEVDEEFQNLLEIFSKKGTG